MDALLLAEFAGSSLVTSEVGTLPRTPDLMLALLAMLAASGLEAEEVIEPEESSREPMPSAAPGPNC
jgi:hypothetical protein